MKNLRILCPAGTYLLINHLPAADLWVLERLRPVEYCGLPVFAFDTLGCFESFQQARNMVHVLLFHGNRKEITNANVNRTSGHDGSA